MSKRETKASRILNQARERMEIARQNVETAEGQLGIANAALNAHTMAYNALEKELAPAPRKTAKKPAASAPAQKEPLIDTASRCGICGNILEHPDHDTEHYLGAHAFEGPKPARAGRKSKQKSEPAPSGQSSETGTDSAGVAASAASGD